MRIVLRLLTYVVVSVVLAYLALRSSYPPHCGYDANCGLDGGYAELGAFGVLLLCLCAGGAVEWVLAWRRLHRRRREMTAETGRG